MIGNLIRQKMDGYLRQAKLYGDWRRVWSKHVWWTREVIIAIANKLPSTDTSVNKLLQNPIEMGQIFGEFYGDRTVAHIEQLFTQHLKTGGDIVTAARDGDTAQVTALTRQWYQNADAIANFLAKANPFYDEATVRSMMHEHLSLTIQEANAYLQGRYNDSINTFDRIQAEAEQMGDYFAQGLISQFPEKFR